MSQSTAAMMRRPYNVDVVGIKIIVVVVVAGGNIGVAAAICCYARVRCNLGFAVWIVVVGSFRLW